LALYEQQAPPAPDAEPGYYRDPLGGARARWWSGETWTSYTGPKVGEAQPWDEALPFPERVCKGCGTKAKTWATQCAKCGRSYSRASGPQLVLIVALALVLGLGGCAGLVALGLQLGEEELSKHEITQAEFDGVALGTSREEVESRLGDPFETADEDGLECLTYYDADSGSLIDAGFFDLCFGDAGRLERKDSYGADD
jgi:hypothetical protein